MSPFYLEDAVTEMDAYTVVTLHFGGNVEATFTCTIMWTYNSDCTQQM